MDKKIAIIQSNYIPWKGYFDIINKVDEFILYDDAQYSKGSWRNRNKIKTRNGSSWLTINIEYKFPQKIKDTKIADKNWGKKHWLTIKSTYGKAQYFNDYKDFLEKLYLNSNEKYLSEINYKFIIAINNLLNIKTNITWSSDYKFTENKKATEKLIEFCQLAGGTEYLSGPSAKNYLDEKLFEQNNIKLLWMDYSAYPEYNQLYPPFIHEVSILDLIFNEGPNTKNFMKSF